MILPPADAAHFIEHYKKLLTEAHRLQGDKPARSLVERLANARNALFADPLLRDAALASLEKAGDPVAPDVRQAVMSLQVKQWIYLRDTTKYSIFLDPDGEHAYGVLGLTDRLRDILGASGALLHAGLVAYRGHYVCDGLLASGVWIGPNMRRDFGDTLAQIKKKGRFHTKPPEQE